MHKNDLINNVKKQEFDAFEMSFQESFGSGLRRTCSLISLNTPYQKSKQRK